MNWGSLVGGIKFVSIACNLIRDYCSDEIKMVVEGGRVSCVEFPRIIFWKEVGRKERWSDENIAEVSTHLGSNANKEGPI